MKQKITESQLRNIIRKSLCEAMNIDADDYNRYLDYLKSQNNKCREIVDYLKNMDINASLKDCDNGGNLQAYCVYVSTQNGNEMAIRDAVRKICPSASFNGGMAGMTIKP